MKKKEVKSQKSEVRMAGARAIATDPQLWLPLVVLAIGIGVLALVK